MSEQHEEVVYVCDVVVTVDPASGEVTRVQVDDEGVRLHPDEDRDSPAVHIAEEAEWPAWEFGF